MPKKKVSQLNLLRHTPKKMKAVRKKVKKSGKEKFYRLSPSTGLNLFRECPRCFWMHYNEKIKRPRGIFPSLPGGMDLVIKDYYDQYRGALPPELRGRVDGVLLPDQALMNQWRNWRTGLVYRDEKNNAELFGALDECLLDGTIYIPLDYKTKGSPPHPGDGERYYQTQLDAYSLLIEKNGYTVTDHAYLLYYYPIKVYTNGRIDFKTLPMKVQTSTERGKKLFTDAVHTLRGSIPKKHSSCLYCFWNQQLQEFD